MMDTFLEYLFSFLITDTIMIPQDSMDGYMAITYFQQKSNHAYYLPIVCKQWMNIFHKMVQHIKIINISSQLLQNQIDCISKHFFNLKNIRIELPKQSQPPYNFNSVYFPNLIQLKMNMINLQNPINFTQNQFPKLQILDIENINSESECQFDFNLSKLKTISMQFIICDDPEGLVNSLNNSIKLETFFSYKLHIDYFINLALPNLKFFEMIRSDCLEDISLWSPKLDGLVLRSCYSLTEVEILREIPRKYIKLLTKYNPSNYLFSGFTVQLISCNNVQFKGDTHRIMGIEEIGNDDDY